MDAPQQDPTPGDGLRIGGGTSYFTLALAPVGLPAPPGRPYFLVSHSEPEDAELRPLLVTWLIDG